MRDSDRTTLLPEWADADHSRDLPVLRAKGEGQHLEYMRAYPAQARDLAKEMAAFATAGGGLILIGVDDAGELLGLSGADDMSARDAYLNRIQGLAHGKVDPPITPRVGFACEGQHAVLFIRVHKGSQPVYYCEGKPYVRHLTESRPAKPDEVIGRVLAWAGVTQSDEGLQVDDKSDRHWKSCLDDILVDLLIALDETPYLPMNPGPDHLQSVLEWAASSLRDTITEYLTDEEAVAQSLRQLAEKCDGLIYTLSSRHSGTWDLLEKQYPPVREMADGLRQAMIGDSLVGDPFLATARDSIKAAVRRVTSLLDCFDQMVGSFRQDDVLSEAGEIGGEVLRLTYQPLGLLADKDWHDLRDASMKLHLLPYHEQFYDHFGADEELKERIGEQAEKIAAIAAMVD